MTKSANRKMELIQERMTAFALFLEDGLFAVERNFPQHLDFVRLHKTKTFAELKKELLQKQAA